MVKEDETLIKGSPLTTTGRPIEDQTTFVSHALKPHLHAPIGRFYAGCNGMRGWHCPLINARLFLYAVKSAKPETMSQVITHFREECGEDRWLVCVSGDDSYVEFRTGPGPSARAKTLGLESDASKMDQHTRNGPLEAEYRIMEFLGIPPDAICLLRHLAGAGMSTRDRNGMGRLFMQPERGFRKRKTGGDDTSFGNTVDMMLMWIHFILNNAEWIVRPDVTGKDAQERVDACFESLGYKMKTQAFENEDVKYATFLKGYWVREPLRDRWIWTMLPSRWLKLFKTRTNPISVYRTNRRKLSMAEAHHEFMGDLRSQLVLPLDWFSTQIKTRLPQTRKLPHKSIVADVGYHWQLEEFETEIDLDMDAAVDFLETRYGITKDELDEFLRLLPDALRRPCVFHSPVWHKLAMDYR